MTDDRGLGLRLERLDELLRAQESIIVAFSGGADSALLLAASARALGPGNVLAATSASESLASGERDAAWRFATDLGVTHLSLTTEELARPGYAANGPDRCYHCKSELLDRLVALAAERGFRKVATGTNADDVRAAHRPGLRAAAERNVITPLADAGLTKVDVRAASRRWDLPTWDKPQAACLASRIAYGVGVDADRLARIDRAEAAVRLELGRSGIPVRNLRVRDLGDRASLEVDEEHLDRVRESAAVLKAVVDAGFPSATLDPRGFRSGSLNDALRSWVLPIVD